MKLEGILSPEGTQKLKHGLKVFLCCALPCLVLFTGGWFYGGIQASTHALGHANLSRDQVSFLRFQMDIDDFIPSYQVSWYQGTQEVEYTVHAVTGQLMEVDFD